jgi:GNAT superfamily N-acetyltransferase
MDVKMASAEDIDLVIPALLELRPHRTAEELKQMLLHQIEEGFQVIYVGDDKMAFAVAGFRTLNMLFSGKTLYIDDLATHSEHRKKGYAGELLRWIIQFAKENGYEHVSLDSGFQRKNAHRLYLNHGLELSSFHFGKKVAEL